MLPFNFRNLGNSHTRQFRSAFLEPILKLDRYMRSVAVSVEDRCPSKCTLAICLFPMIGKTISSRDMQKPTINKAFCIGMPNHQSLEIQGFPFLFVTHDNTSQSLADDPLGPIDYFFGRLLFPLISLFTSSPSIPKPNFILFNSY